MNQSSVTDIESTPLLKEEVEVVEVPVASSSLSKSARASIALVSIVALAAVAFVSYEQTRGMSSATHLKRNSLWNSDVSICENTYVEGVTPRTAALGCVVFSTDDLYGANYLDDAMYTQTVCIASTGPSNGRVDISYRNMQQLGFIDPETGKSRLSGINPGQDVNVELYSGPNFDGESVTVDSGNIDGALPIKQFLSGNSTNDNVYSFSVISQAAYFFAGPQCGQDTQICYGLSPNSDIVKPQPNGCIIMSNQDPTAPGKEESSSFVARVCTTDKAVPYNAGVVVLPKKSLQALNMVKGEEVGGKSAISYINRQGESTSIKYYTSAEPNGYHHSHTGRLGIWNDKIKSITISSSTNQLPDDCGSITRVGQK